jgi:hypothetical protein
LLASSGFALGIVRAGGGLVKFPASLSAETAGWEVHGVPADTYAAETGDWDEMIRESSRMSVFGYEAWPTLTKFDDRVI